MADPDDILMEFDDGGEFMISGGAHHHPHHAPNDGEEFYKLALYHANPSDQGLSRPIKAQSRVFY